MTDITKCKVVGLTFTERYPDWCYELADALEADTHLGESLPVVLKANPANKFDADAIEVHVPFLNSMVGHIPRTHNRPIAEGMRAGFIYLAELAVRIHPDHPENPGLDITIKRM